MKRLRNVAIFLVALPLLACTSSNTPTNVQSNSGYDSEYRETTRSSQQYGQGAAAEQPLVEPSPTLMQIGTETGDMYPGEDYYVYAVVDNPDNRNLQYVWSLKGGTLSEVPEAERGRLATEVAQAKTDALNPPVSEQPATPAEAAPVSQPAAGAPAAGGAPAAQGAQAAPGAPAAPAGAQLGAPAAAGPQQPTQPTQQTMGAGGAPPGSGLPGSQPTLPSYESGIGSGAYSQPLPAAPSGPPAGGGALPSVSGGQQPSSSLRGGSGAKDTSSAKTRKISKVIERRMVMGPEEPQPDQEFIGPQQVDTETARGVNEQITKARQAVGGEAAEAVTGEATREEPAGQVNTAETQLPGELAPEVLEESPSQVKARSENIRSEYNAWNEEGTGAKREQALGGYGEAGEEASEEPLTAEQSYEVVTLVTDDPFVVWTPDKPGKYQLFCKLAWKDEDMTEPRELDLEVRLKDPAIELSKDFPDVVREDDAVFVKLDASQLPSFDKGLFTVTYDFDKLSFRGAELGEFFDDDPAASIYYAQPDKAQGKVLIAIDANTELTELSGSGTLAYLKFTAKQDIESQADTQLALVADTAARYILDKNGENVLPLPVTTPPFMTDVIMPAPSAAPATPGAPGAAGAPNALAKGEEGKQGKFASYPDTLNRTQAGEIARTYNVTEDQLDDMLTKGQIQGAHRTSTESNAPWAIPKANLITALEGLKTQTPLPGGAPSGVGPQQPVPEGPSQQNVGPTKPAGPVGPQLPAEVPAPQT